MKPFSEEMRYEYDLGPQSWVVDVGAHMGTFAREITRRYDCNVFGFEPIFSFWQQAWKDQTPKTLIVPVALGGSTRTEDMKIAGDSTGMFCDSREHAIVNVLDVAYLWRLFDHINLLKLNCEGMEYEILERILELCMQQDIENIQIQFHTNAPNYNERRLKTMDKLADTHVLTYEYPYVWENWKRK